MGFAYHKANTLIMALLSSCLFNLMLQPKMEFNNDSAVILINFTLHVFYIWILYETLGESIYLPTKYQSSRLTH